MIQWVDAELIKWGRYFRDNNNELGYPTSSVEKRMQEGGFGNDNKGRRAPDPYVPEDVELMEIIVRRLPTDIKIVVIEAYMTGGTREDQAQRLTIKLKRKVLRARLYEMIDYSHHHIAGFYTAMGLITNKSIDTSGQ